jgi:hypothetical protein
MKPEPNEAISLSPLAKTKAPQASAPSSAPTCPWEQYLTGKKTSPELFLATMAKGPITIPDEETRKRFTVALAAKPDRLTRFILLLQASATSGNTIRKIVTDFAEASIRQFGVVSFPEPLDAAAFRQTVASWIEDIPQKPLKPADLNILFLLLHFGSQRQLLHHDAAFSLVSTAVSKSAKPARKASPTARQKTPLEVLLAATPSRPLLTALVAYSKAWRTQCDDLDERIEQQTEEIARLALESARQQSTISGLEKEIATLKEQKSAAEIKMAELENQIVQIHDGYKHKLDDLRGRIRGVMQGQLTRWLQTSLDAARSDPPFTKVVEERLEDALKLIEKEIQWLQPSA